MDSPQYRALCDACERSAAISRSTADQVDNARRHFDFVKKNGSYFGGVFEVRACDEELERLKVVRAGAFEVWLRAIAARAAAVTRQLVQQAYLLASTDLFRLSAWLSAAL